MTAIEAPSTLAITCSAVEKTYRLGATKVPALRGVDLDVHKGELLMLVGPSGCGKTTLISVIAGILDHDEGDCRVFGLDLRHMAQGKRTRFRGANIGFVFQAFNLLPTLTATENVSVPLLLNGCGRREAEDRAREMLLRVGLEKELKRLPRELSGGQQQRVAIARALVHNPRLIVCDEPTSALDHETGTRVMELMREVAVGPDRALVIVTHDSRIFRHADRIAMMNDGRISRIVTDPATLA